MGFLLGNAEVYSEDKPLFKELGLKEFEIDNREKYFVGQVVNGEGYINIWVECLPAEFWSFEIKSRENGNITKFSTGSGLLSDFIKTAQQIMDGMIVIDAN